MNPIERWSPQQAKLHPFVLGEPLLKPFVPPMELKNAQPKVATATADPTANGSAKMPVVDQKRPYGGLPPAPQRSATRTYQDAAAYNQHLANQQSYAAANAANALRAAQQPTNPYAEAPRTAQQQHQQQQQQQAAAAAQISASYYNNAQAVSSHHQQQQYASGSQPKPLRNSTSGPLPPPAAAIPANPPAVHHYPTRGRSLTINQVDAVPPQMQRIGLDLSSIAGQSMTPVLRRDDQREAWERRQQTGNGDLSRKISISRHHPALDLLTQQAEMGYRPGGGYPVMKAQQPYSPQHAQQPFSVVVDSQGRQIAHQPSQYDAVLAAPPPVHTYGAQMGPRYAAPVHSSGPSMSYDTSFDSFDGRDGMAMMYTPLQATTASSQQYARQPQMSQQAFYAPPTAAFASPPQSAQQGSFSWGAQLPRGFGHQLKRQSSEQFGP